MRQELLRRATTRWTIIAGRFQPYHLGHADLINSALTTVGPPLLIAVIVSRRPELCCADKSALGPRADKVHRDQTANPFSYDLRREMVLADWGHMRGAGGIEVQPIPRPQGPTDWWEFVVEFLPRDRQWLLNDRADPWERKKERFFKDQGEDVVWHDKPGRIMSGTELRRLLAQGRSLSEHVSDAVLDVLRAHGVLQ